MDPHPPLPPPPPGALPEPPQPEPEPGSPSGSAAKVALVAAGLLVVLLGIGVGTLLWLRAPGLCDGSTVESTRFGYCLAAPGWEFTNERSSSELPYDELVHPADASSVRILAVEVGAEANLGDVVSNVRESEAEQGITPGDISDTSVAGVPAAQWDLLLQEGDVEVQVREVIFLREGTAWRVHLIADPEGFDARVPEFERILNSWTFR
ncbi:MAG TPA: hypothetical protein VFQ40_04400 [Actinomycetota bacterium]|nr:hypothetical protein [Actinomycetota bacterium]